MDDERRRADLSKHGVRLEPEDFVEYGAAMFQGWRELDVSLFGELSRQVVAEVVIRPVRSTVNGSLLVVELWAEQHQPGGFVWTFGSVVAADAPTEALADQACARRAGSLPDIDESNPDVVENG